MRANTLIKNLETNSIGLPNGDYTYTNYIDVKSVKTLMINFAKYHVEKALEEASKNAIYNKSQYDYLNKIIIDKNSILESYSLNNIK